MVIAYLSVALSGRFMRFVAAVSVILIAKRKLIMGGAGHAKKNNSRVGARTPGMP
jgi:hypothetical protein